MADSMFRHSGKCKGNLLLDVGRLLSVRTPSLAIGAEGIKLGVVEFRLKRAGATEVELSCQKCGNTISLSTPEGIKQVDAVCTICGEGKPLNQMHSNNIFPCICTDCKSALMGESAPKGERIKKVCNYMKITSEFKFVPFSEVLSKPISL